MTRTGTANFGKCTSRGEWTPLNTILMILGFIVFWPLGLAMLAYILWGDRMEIDKHWQSVKSEFTGARDSYRPGNFSSATGNHAFDEYRAETLRKLEEEHRLRKERLREEEREFTEFMRELRRARDAEEFENFMNRKNNPKES
jgi:hypothetical protein